jgi:hypothetical protein
VFIVFHTLLFLITTPRRRFESFRDRYSFFVLDLCSVGPRFCLLILDLGSRSCIYYSNRPFLS